MAEQNRGERTGPTGQGRMGCWRPVGEEGQGQGSAAAVLPGRLAAGRAGAEGGLWPQQAAGRPRAGLQGPGLWGKLPRVSSGPSQEPRWRRDRWAQRPRFGAWARAGGMAGEGPRRRLPALAQGKGHVGARDQRARALTAELTQRNGAWRANSRPGPGARSRAWAVGGSGWQWVAVSLPGWGSRTVASGDQQKLARNTGHPLVGPGTHRGSGPWRALIQAVTQL